MNPPLQWQLKPGFATEEEIEMAREIIVEELQMSLDGHKANAVFSALIRLSGEVTSKP